MLNTFERDLIAKERHQDLLRFSAQRQLAEEATRGGRTTGLFAIFTGRRGDAASALPKATATDARAA